MDSGVIQRLEPPFVFDSASFIGAIFVPPIASPVCCDLRSSSLNSKRGASFGTAFLMMDVD